MRPLAAFHRANTLTYGALLASIAAIAAAVHGNAPAAGALIATAVLADTFDGRFARRFSRTPAERLVGAHLDSLSDAIAFGAGPCLCMILLTPPATAWVELGWWAAFAAFAACAITRLAFFNVSHGHIDGFVGLPAPVAALAWSSAMLLEPGAMLSTAILFAAAAAMVVPLRVPRPTGAGLAAFAAWPLLTIAAHVAAL